MAVNSNTLSSTKEKAEMKLHFSSCGVSRGDDTCRSNEKFDLILWPCCAAKEYKTRRDSKYAWLKSNGYLHGTSIVPPRDDNFFFELFANLSLKVELRKQI
ncbi:hypothetical protein RUM44_009305 [Polyplax serrata]|uniref:Uncharacterized protein n=1 Tax=Polyplax serrata TaxID=468196 RepID=A0ABR1ATU2_POLSC